VAWRDMALETATDGILWDLMSGSVSVGEAAERNLRVAFHRRRWRAYGTQVILGPVLKRWPWSGRGV
jgi:hypothetical protein